MPVFRAGVTVGLLMIGAIMVLLGAILLLSALSSGEIYLSRGGVPDAPELIARASDAARYWQYVFGLGALPVVLGFLLTRWAWRQIETGGH